MPGSGTATWSPPSLSEGNHCAGPPRRLLDSADFIDSLFTDYGDHISAFEREAIAGFHVDENEYHLGLVTHEGRKKAAFPALLSAIAR